MDNSKTRSGNQCTPKTYITIQANHTSEQWYPSSSWTRSSTALSCLWELWMLARYKFTFARLIYIVQPWISGQPSHTEPCHDDRVLLAMGLLLCILCLWAAQLTFSSIPRQAISDKVQDVIHPHSTSSFLFSFVHHRSSSSLNPRSIILPPSAQWPVSLECYVMLHNNTVSTVHPSNYTLQ